MACEIFSRLFCAPQSPLHDRYGKLAALLHHELSSAIFAAGDVSEPPYFVKGVTLERENTVLLAKMKNYEENENWMDAEEQRRAMGVRLTSAIWARKARAERFVRWKLVSQHAAILMRTLEAAAVRQRRKLERDQMKKLLLRWQGWSEEHKLLAQRPAEELRDRPPPKLKVVKEEEEEVDAAAGQKLVDQLFCALPSNDLT